MQFQMQYTWRAPDVASKCMQMEGKNYGKKNNNIGKKYARRLNRRCQSISIMINSAQYSSFNIARHMVTATNSFARFIWFSVVVFALFPISKQKRLNEEGWERMKENTRGERKIVTVNLGVDDYYYCGWTNGRRNCLALETHTSQVCYMRRPVYYVISAQHILYLQNVYARVAASEMRCPWMLM